MFGPATTGSVIDLLYPSALKLGLIFKMESYRWTANIQLLSIAIFKLYSQSLTVLTLSSVAFEIVQVVLFTDHFVLF